jgi:hypothetical protein
VVVAVVVDDVVVVVAVVVVAAVVVDEVVVVAVVVVVVGVVASDVVVSTVVVPVPAPYADAAPAAARRTPRTRSQTPRRIAPVCRTRRRFVEIAEIRYTASTTACQQLTRPAVPVPTIWPWPSRRAQVSLSKSSISSSGTRSQP